MTEKEFEQQNVFGKGGENSAYAQYFIGKSFLNPLTDQKCGLFLANVTFEPGCRNNWHIHHAKSGGGQMLVCTAGEGWYCEEGRARQPDSRNGHRYPRERPPLARREERQLVFAHSL